MLGQAEGVNHGSDEYQLRQFKEENVEGLEFHLSKNRLSLLKVVGMSSRSNMIGRDLIKGEGTILVLVEDKGTRGTDLVLDRMMIIRR